MGRLSDSGSRKNLPPFISPSSSFTSTSYSKRSRAVRRLPSLPKPPLAPPAPHFVGRRRTKKALTRLWMRMDRWGRCEVFMCDKAFIAERSGVYARDVRIIGPLLSRCTGIFAREKAMVICLEFVRAIVTADEVLLLEPLAQEVIPFVDRLRQQFPLKSVEDDVGATQVDDLDRNKHAETDSECELPFEFKVLELALEAVCLSFHSSLSDLNRHVVFVMDDLTKNVSSRNLERVRSLKSNLTSLLAGVHKVRDEVEHLLDHNENMARLHLSRKQVKSLQDESVVAAATLNCNFPSQKNLARPNSVNQAMRITSIAPLDSDAGDLEMLLESYFMQLDGIRNRITMVRGYIVDTEDYISIQLDNQRNKLIQLHLTLIIVSFGIAINTWIAASFAMNLPHNGVTNTTVGLFWPFVGGTSSFCLLVIILLFGYAWRNRLLCS